MPESQHVLLREALKRCQPNFLNDSRHDALVDTSPEGVAMVWREKCSKTAND